MDEYKILLLLQANSSGDKIIILHQGYFWKKSTLIQVNEKNSSVYATVAAFKIIDYKLKVTQG